jgi:hypothetical protein
VSLNKKIGVNIMKKNRLGIIFFMLIIAFSGISVGYATWTDTINVYGTIKTGSVSWEVIDYSGTWVYKDMNSDECIMLDEPISDPNFLLLAHAEAFPGNDDYDVYVVFDNLFPCTWFKADYIIKYTGTIPGKISNIDYSYISDNNWIDPLLISDNIYVNFKDCDGSDINLGHQLHENDEIIVEHWIKIPQQQDLMNVSGSFKVRFEVIQWNEYTPPSGNIPPSGETPLDISEYVIYQASSSISYTIPEGIIVNPGDYIIISRDSTKEDFENYWGVSLASDVVFLTSNDNFPVINGDETYELRDKTDTIVDGPTGQPLITYHTIERIKTYDNPLLLENWKINPDSFATPGSGADGNGLAGLVINEYSDASGTGNWKYEFIELYYDMI